MTKKLERMSEEELIEHYTKWFFNNTLKDEIDLKRMLKKLIFHIKLKELKCFVSEDN